MDSCGASPVDRHARVLTSRAAARRNSSRLSVEAIHGRQPSAPRRGWRLQMRKYGVGLAGLIIAASAVFGGGIGRAEEQANAARNGCRHLPSWGDLRAALVAARNEANGGLNLDMWGTHRRSRRRRVCGGVHRRRARRSVARQPGDLRAESQHRQRVQPCAGWRSQQPTCSRPCSPEAACSDCRRVIRSPRSPRMAAARTAMGVPTIRWSASALAA